MKTELLIRIIYLLVGALLPLGYLIYREYKERIKIIKRSKNKSI
ncbi:hypothetical protein [Aquimarina sp. AU119]|nr:hypothetical protein [Aquimarina sp. AU119]